MFLDQGQITQSMLSSLHKLLLQTMDGKLVSCEVLEHGWRRGFTE
jgi:hypothetical protein